jgi:hypothetical protein
VNAPFDNPLYVVEQPKLLGLPLSCLSRMSIMVDSQSRTEYV